MVQNLPWPDVSLKHRGRRDRGGQWDAASMCNMIPPRGSTPGPVPLPLHSSYWPTSVGLGTQGHCPARLKNPNPVRNLLLISRF